MDRGNGITEPSVERKRPNYWKYGFFLIFLLSVVSNGYLLLRQTKSSVVTNNRLDENANPTGETSGLAAGTPSISLKPAPSSIPKSQYSLQLPYNWSYDFGSDSRFGGVINDKVGEIEGVKTYENSCLNYFKGRFAEGSRESVLDQWTQKIGKNTWFVAHIDVRCMGKCNWNVYCVEGENKIFTMYLDYDLAKNNPVLIKDTLSTFSFEN